MSEPKDKDLRPDAPDPASTTDDDLTREIRRGRPFDVAEAVGREAGDALKGASPVGPDRQLLMATRELLEKRVVDPEGILIQTVLVRLEGNPPLLANHFDDPAGLVRTWLETVLASRLALTDFVRQVDARWGRAYGETPRFEVHGRQPAPDDPYTVADVQATLEGLRDALA